MALATPRGLRDFDTLLPALTTALKVGASHPPTASLAVGALEVPS